MSEDTTRYFWFSEKQKKATSDTWGQPPRRPCYVTIDGKETEYTQCGKENHPPLFDDMVFLGTALESASWVG